MGNGGGWCLCMLSTAQGGCSSSEEIDANSTTATGENVESMSEN